VKKSKPDQSICVYGAGVLLKHLQAVTKEFDGVQNKPEDIEFIHRMRVASRRLRSAFPLFETCLPAKKSKGWQEQIKNITQALGAARDADVQIDRLQTFYASITDLRFRPGVARLLLRLRQKRSRLQAPIGEAMESVKASGVLTEMQAHLASLADLQSEVYLYSPALYEHSFNAIHSRLDELMAYDEIVPQPEKKEELHAMRISAKWLRYTLENMAMLYPNGLKSHIQTVRKIQEALGDIHDCDVWLEFLPQFAEKERQRVFNYFGNARAFKRIEPGILHFYDERLATRNRIYDQYVCDWQQWKEEGTWSTLREIIQSPITMNMPAIGPSEETQPQPEE
jgi:CHAD domain-containing protein